MQKEKKPPGVANVKSANINYARLVTGPLKRRGASPQPRASFGKCAAVKYKVHMYSYCTCNGH